jgi:hypothetical protein
MIGRFTSLFVSGFIPRIVLPAALTLALACGSADPAGPADQSSIAILAGNNQQGASGALLGAATSVTVRDANDAALANVEVRFSIMGGGGATSDTLVRTNAGGVASTEWYLGPAAGIENTLRATYGSRTVDFTAQSVAGIPGQTFYGD